MKQSLINIICILFVAVMAVGCGGKKKGASSEVPSSQQTGAATSAQVISADEGVEYLRNVTGLYKPWQQVRVPLSVKINSPKSFSISGTAEMLRGKSVLISLKFIGMEMVWLYVSDTNITVADKMNKRYISEPPAKFLGGFNVNTYDLQDLLIGRPFVLGTNDISDVNPELFTFASDGAGGWSLQPESEIESMEYGFWFEPKTVLNAAVVQLLNKTPVALLYGEPVNTPCGPMASQIGIKTKIGATEIDATIFWNWKRAKWGDVFNPREPKVPDSYNKVDGASVLKSLTNL